MEATERRKAGWWNRRAGHSFRGKTLLGCALLASLLGLQACRAQQSWPLWEAYAQHFVDGQGRVIDRSAGDRTTSEGQAYAMFFALIDNDRNRFDRLLDWTEANLAGGDLTTRLPAWDWGRAGGGEWKIRDSNSASDADLWLAYTLIEAGRLWKEPRFATLGRTLARLIARQEVVLVQGVGTVLAPGPSGFHVDDHASEPAGQSSDRWILNPSYLPPPLLARLAQAVPDGPWASVQDTLPTLIGGAASHGFAMDWVSAGNGTVKPSPPPRESSAGAREEHPAGSYDAIRVYLWAGLTDAGAPGTASLDTQLSGMTAYMRSAATPPLEVDPTGSVVRAESPPGFSAAVIPLLNRIGLKTQARAQADRLLATHDAGSGLYGRGMEYYDQNLALFSTGFTEQRFRFERDGRLHVRWK